MTDRPDPARDPRRIRSVAVHREDVANALEATLRSDRTVVLRVTPPYSGRMRARIHRVGTGDGGDGERIDSRDGRGNASTSVPDTRSTVPDAPVHLDPRHLVEDLPAYPEVDDTTAEDPDSGLEARRERHGAAVENWRERVRGSVGGTVLIPVGGGRDSNPGGTDHAGDGRAELHEIDVVALGQVRDPGTET